MIPKVIHYCWFGSGEKNDTIKKCIQSWKNNLPDYTIIEWNEDNFDYNLLEYSKQAYEKKKYAFVSDVARVKALYEYGGIYLDTDVMVYRTFDSILDNECVLGFEEGNYIATSFMACSKGNKLMNDFYNLYKSISFYNNDGTINTATNVQKLTNMLVEKGLKMNNEYQVINNITIYPQEYFSPYDYSNCISLKTKNTICEHLFLISWMSKKEQLKKSIKRIMAKTLGVNNMNMLRNIGIMKKK